MKQQTLAMGAGQGAGFETHSHRSQHDEFHGTMRAITGSHETAHPLYPFGCGLTD